MKKIFPDENVITTKLFNISQDWETPIPGFFILSPLRKLRSISDFTDAEALEFVTLVRKIRIGMREILNINDVYLFQNEDTEHNFHLWIFPRHSWMERFGRKIESVRPIMKYATEHRLDDNLVQEVKESVRTMKTFLSGSL
jgi:diadenosine tetraphosphate (Ap4A) HIT family hydrolase